jgi:hypothetical protein
MATFHSFGIILVFEAPQKLKQVVGAAFIALGYQRCKERDGALLMKVLYLVYERSDLRKDPKV